MSHLDRRRVTNSECRRICATAIWEHAANGRIYPRARSIGPRGIRESERQEEHDEQSRHRGREGFDIQLRRARVARSKRSAAPTSGDESAGAATRSADAAGKIPARKPRLRSLQYVRQLRQSRELGAGRQTLRPLRLPPNPRLLRQPERAGLNRDTDCSDTNAGSVGCSPP